MDDLVRWLGEQLGEDERIARAADPGPWKSDSLGRHDQAAIKPGAPTSLIQFDGSRAAANGTHAARHDPARVLAEIYAKRALMKQIFSYEAKIDGEWGCCHDAEEIEAGECEETPPSEIDALRLLALPYADRPGYRDDWRP